MMGWGTGNIGGGSGGLNFKVVGGTSAPANPKENTIWVNTDQKITSWVFSATQPTEPTEGMVWIIIGTSSHVEFNALKKNSLTVYPLSAKQYVSGAWVDKTAKSYQGGKWVEWITYLYNAGDKCTDITGGWTTSGYSHRGWSFGGYTSNSDNMEITQITGQCVGGVGTVNKVNLSKYKTLKVKITNSENGLHILVTSAKDSLENCSLAQWYTYSAGEQEVSISIDTIDSGYIAFSSEGTTVIHKVWLE